MGLIHQNIARLFYQLGKPRVPQYMHELAQLQWLSRDELLTLQRGHLHQMLEYANTYVPYYRDMFKEIGFHPADFITDPASFQKIPLLTKPMIRQHYDRLITTEEARRNQLVRVKTGGTTGEPLWFAKDKTYLDYNIAHDYYAMTLSGWQIGQPQFWLWGHVPDKGLPTGLAAMTGKLKDWLVARFDSNAFILSYESMEQLATQLEKHPDGLLWSYVSTLYRFAQFLQERGGPIKLRAAYTAAEPLFEPQRQFIQQALGCPVFNNYSSIDTGDIAVECDCHNGLHIMTRNCYVEVENEGQPMPDGEAGEFILTNLTNYGMPLLRYKIEDWGRKSTRSCPCGRNWPLLEVVEGRAIDLFKTRDGRTVYGAFAKDLIPTLGQVKQFQVVQKSLDLVIFRIVHEGPLDQEKLQQVEQVCRGALGNQVTVKFEFPDSLPATPTGKHRYLISEIK